MFLKHGDEPALMEFIDLMAIAVASEVNILDPDYLLIGGGVFGMKGFPMEAFRERIRARVRKPYPAQNLHLIFAEDEADKSVRGGARYALEILEHGMRRN